MKRIDGKLIRSLNNQAKRSDRKRINYNFHDGSQDPLQRMLNAMQPGTYLQPHKHENPDKREVFLALTGRFVVIQFNDDGPTVSLELNAGATVIVDETIGENAELRTETGNT